MARWFHCPYLNAEVELTDERDHHILTRHPDMAPGHAALIQQTLSEPDAIHPSPTYNDRLLFSRWYDELRGGKYVMVVVVLQSAPVRNWIATAHLLREAIPGEALWRRS